MKKFQFLSILLVLFVIGCNIEEPVEEIFYDTPEFDERIDMFKFSKCVESCMDSGKVILKTFKNDTLTLELGHWMNCVWKRDSTFVKKIDLSDDTLNIILDKGYTMTSGYKNHGLVACRCYFTMKLKMHGLKRNPNVFLINSNPLVNGSPMQFMFEDL